jgi:hypothetical protein
LGKVLEELVGGRAKKAAATPWGLKGEATFIFNGTLEQAQALLRVLKGGLVTKTLDKNNVQEFLLILLRDTLKHTPTYRCVAVGEEPPFRWKVTLQPQPDRARELTQEMVSTWTGNRRLAFTYGRKGEQRERQGDRISSFSWGIRARTERGWRSYSWEKIATARVPLVESFTLTFLSLTEAEERHFSWRGERAAGEGGAVLFEEPSLRGTFTTSLKSPKKTPAGE